MTDGEALLAAVLAAPADEVVDALTGRPRRSRRRIARRLDVPDPDPAG